MKGIIHEERPEFVLRSNRKAGNNYSGYVLDLPSCIATGKTRKETENRMIEAISFHIQGLMEDEPGLRKVESSSPIIEFQYSDSSE